MSARRPHIVALVCGSIRKLADFLVVMHRVLAMRDAGIVDTVILSTWTEELEADAGRHLWLRRAGVRSTTTPFAAWSAINATRALPSYLMSALVQDTQLAAGLDFIRQDTGGLDPSEIVVWKLRTDLMIPRLELFTARLRALREMPAAGLDTIRIHHASVLDYFDIADITYVTRLSDAHRFGGLRASHVPFYLGKHIPTEAIMCGNHHTFAIAAFQLVNTLLYPERKRLRQLVADCIGQDRTIPALSELAALHLHILAHDYRIERSSPWDAPFDIEMLLVGGEVPGMRAYRELNQVLTDDAPLARIRAGQVTSCTPFGEAVLRTLAALRADDAPAAAQTLGAQLAPSLAAVVREHVAMDAPRTAAFNAFAGRFDPPPGPDPRPAHLADSLGLLRPPAPYRMRPDELAAVEAAAPRDALALAHAVLHVLARSIAPSDAEETQAPARARLHYWANLFASMDLRHPVVSAMATLDPAFAPAITQERESQLRWLAGAELAFGASPD